jgi:hypothetical protein
MEKADDVRRSAAQAHNLDSMVPSASQHIFGCKCSFWFHNWSEFFLIHPITINSSMSCLPAACWEYVSHRRWYDAHNFGTKFERSHRQSEEYCPLRNWSVLSACSIRCTIFEFVHTPMWFFWKVSPILWHRDGSTVRCHTERHGDFQIVFSSSRPNEEEPRLSCINVQ